MRFGKFFSKQKPFRWMWIFSAVFLAGIISRFVYVLEIGLHPFLNNPLPKTDLFVYDILAKNFIHPNPIEMGSTIYLTTVGYIALIYRLFGEGHLPVYIMNFFLSMISVCFLIAIGRNIFGRVAGIATGLVFLFYRMNFFYDGLKCGTALSQFLLIASLFSFVMLVKHKKIYFYMLFLLFGLLSCLMRIFYWFIFIPLTIYCIVRFKQWRRPWLIVVNCLFIILSIWLFQCTQVSDGYGQRFGVHFYIGNHAEANGLLQSIPGIPSTGEGFAKDSILKAYEESGSKDDLEGYWIRKAVGSYQNQYGEWLRVLMKKFSYLTNNFEVHNHSSVYYYEKYTNLKYFPRMNFSFLFSLSLVGMFLVFFSKHKDGRILFVLMGLLLAMVLSIFITARYRMPLIPFLCLYAGFAVQEFFVFIKGKNYWKVGWCILLIVVGMLWSSHSISSSSKDRDIAFWEMEKRRAHNYYYNVERLRQKYQEWDHLNYYQKVLLTRDLQDWDMPHEFVEAYDMVFPLAKGDRRNRNILLMHRAKFEESNFKFQKAMRIWRILAQDDDWESMAKEKIKEIEIIGPFLDKSFKE